LRRNTWDVLVFNCRKINFDSWLARKQIQINIFILINLILTTLSMTCLAW
jgi:hypothetical protein